jgi:nickel-responsive transcriptional regulator NikR
MHRHDQAGHALEQLADAVDRLAQVQTISSLVTEPWLAVSAACVKPADQMMLRRRLSPSCLRGWLKPSFRPKAIAATSVKIGLASLVYVFDHGVREIPKRLANAYHDHHDLSVATMHVHLDHDNCLELAVLRGDSTAVREFSRWVIAERGVRHGHVTFIPVEIEETVHAHGDAGHSHRHSHVNPKG